jgi:hypothetical protein
VSDRHRELPNGVRGDAGAITKVNLQRAAGIGAPDDELHGPVLVGGTRRDRRHGTPAFLRLRRVIEQSDHRSGNQKKTHG